MTWGPLIVTLYGELVSLGDGLGVAVSLADGEALGELESEGLGVGVGVSVGDGLGELVSDGVGVGVGAQGSITVEIFP